VWKIEVTELAGISDYVNGQWTEGECGLLGRSGDDLVGCNGRNFFYSRQLRHYNMFIKRT